MRRAQAVHPGLVHLEGAERQLCQAECLCVFDPLLDVGVGAVTAVELWEIVVLLVGEECLVAPAVGIDQRQLRAGVGALAAAEKPHALSPTREVKQAAQLRHIGLARPRGMLRDGLPVLADRRNPRVLGELCDRLAHVGAQIVPDREAHLALGRSR